MIYNLHQWRFQRGLRTCHAIEKGDTDKIGWIIMKIATFNINGIKARAETLCRWLDETNPDVAILQEIKSVDENFPRDLFEERGYNVETHGQKSFNGVAILSKYPLEDVVRGLPGDDSDEQARWIEATVVGKTAIGSVASISRTGTLRLVQNLIINWRGWNACTIVHRR